MAMKWSWRIGEFADTGVYIHTTFLLLLGWVTFTGWLQARTLIGAWGSVAFILALFFVVVLHEYGHVLTARKSGIKTRDITLLPTSGVARLERAPDDPKQELWVVLAGPAVNVVIAAVLFIWLTVTNAMQSLSALTMTSGSFIERLMLVSVVLVPFNMIPAFPMGGGRAVRALLAMRLEYTQATQIAASRSGPSLKGGRGSRLDCGARVMLTA